MFKIKNLVALCCFWAITLAATAAWSSICFAPSGGCQEGSGIGIDDGGGTSIRNPGSIDSCPGYNLYEKLTGKGYEDDNGNSLCESCIQNGKTYWRCKAHQCATKFDRVDKEGEPEEGYDCEDCYTAKDVLWHCVPHPCDAKYKLEKNDYHRDCSDTCVSARKTLYNCVCDAEHPLEVGGKCIKECNGYAEEYVEASDSCECQTGYTRRNGICSPESVSVSCEELLDKFTRVQYTKMSNSDCEANARALGIKQCIGQDDYWAGAAKACGGVANMPTGDELRELAKCMYGKSTADDVMYGTRKDSYLEQLGLNTGDHVFVWQDYQSTNNKRSVVRMFDTAGTIPYWAERNGNNYYTGNGSSARNWENTSILSETLCHRKKTDANCADLVTRFETKSYSAISQSTCNSNKTALSITNCPVATDYWAGAVKTCGGVDMIASEDDLFELAKCMYGKTQASSSMYGTRNNTYLSSLGLSTNSHEYVWSAYQNNKGDHNAIVRMFASDGSIQYWAERDGSKYYEGNGSYPTDWKSSGIKSKVLCRKPVTTETTTPSNTNQDVTVYYDAPTDCNYSFTLTNTSTGATTQIGAATQQIAAGTYKVRPSTSAVQSFTIRMGRGGTPTSFSPSGGNYTFSAGNDYWLVPSCSNGGGGGNGGADACPSGFPNRYTNIPITGNQCTDVCCADGAQQPLSYSYMTGCTPRGSYYTCQYTGQTNFILCYRSVSGMLYETEAAGQGMESGRFCQPGWIRVPNYTRCTGSYLVGCSG